MAIKLISMKCPECGANLEVEEGRKQFYCSYCGSKIMLQDDNEYTYHHIDEAEVKRAEADREIRMRELDLEESAQKQQNSFKKPLTIVWLIVSIIVITVCILIIVFVDKETGFLLLYFLCAPVVGGGAVVIFGVIPENEEEKRLIRNGGIKFPSSFEPFDEHNYQSAETILRSAGFVNVSCVNMHDLTLGLLKKPGRIESITVDGETISSGGRIFLPSASIVITYHGK